LGIGMSFLIIQNNLDTSIASGASRPNISSVVSSNIRVGYNHTLWPLMADTTWATNFFFGCPCAPGSFGPNHPDCTICPAGNYCPMGSTHPVFGAQAPIPCPAGYACPAGSSAPNLCPASSFSPGNAGSCSPCQFGFLCVNPGTSAPVPCPAGHYCSVPNVTQVPCTPGYFSAALATSCTPCSPGEYAPLSATANKCTICDLKRFCPRMALTETFPCPPGSQCPAGNSQPLLCLPGSYSPGLVDLCLTCPVSNYCNSYNMSSPLTCPLGTFCGYTGMSSPDVVTATTVQFTNKYRNAAGWPRREEWRTVAPGTVTLQFSANCTSDVNVLLFSTNNMTANVSWVLAIGALGNTAVSLFQRPLGCQSPSCSILLSTVITGTMCQSGVFVPWWMQYRAASGVVLFGRGLVVGAGGVFSFLISSWPNLDQVSFTNSESLWSLENILISACAPGQYPMSLSCLPCPIGSTCSDGNIAVPASPGVCPTTLPPPPPPAHTHKHTYTHNCDNDN
jgi:hypothetical protein